MLHFNILDDSKEEFHLLLNDDMLQNILVFIFDMFSNTV